MATPLKTSSKTAVTDVEKQATVRFPRALDESASVVCRFWPGPLACNFSAETARVKGVLALQALCGVVDVPGRDRCSVPVPVGTLARTEAHDQRRPAPVLCGQRDCRSVSVHGMARSQ